MLITRCEWHRAYWGYAAYTGYKRDGRWRWAITGGICPACAAVLRGAGDAARRPAWAREVGRVAVALTALAAWALVVLLAGCVTDEGPKPAHYECSRVRVLGVVPIDLCEMVRDKP